MSGGFVYDEDSSEDKLKNFLDKARIMTPSTMFIGDQMERLFANGADANHGKNHVPVVYFSLNKIGYSFLITELDPSDRDLAYGLCDYDTNLRIDKFRISTIFNLAEEKGAILRSHPETRLKYPLAVYAQVAAAIGTIIVDNNPDKFHKLFQEFGGGQNLDTTQFLSSNENLTKTKNLLLVGL